jgi:hypothetical protein
MKAGSGKNQRKPAFTFTEFITITNQITFRTQQNDLQVALSVLAPAEHPVSDRRQNLFSDSDNGLCLIENVCAFVRSPN